MNTVLHSGVVIEIKQGWADNISLSAAIVQGWVVSFR